MTTNDIIPEKYYSLSAVFKMRALPWIKSFRTLKNLVRQDTEKYGGEKFKAIRTGSKQGTRYNIKGQHLIELIEKMNTEGFTINGGNGKRNTT